MKTAKQILVDAKGVVDHGWAHEGAYRVIDGVECYCALLALGNVDDSGRKQPYREATKFLGDAIYPGAGFNAHDAWLKIGDWNDEPERTKEEVLAAFDKAIELAGEA